MKETTSCLHLLNGHVYLAFTLVILTDYVPAIYRERLVFKLEFLKRLYSEHSDAHSFTGLQTLELSPFMSLIPCLKGKEY